MSSESIAFSHSGGHGQSRRGTRGSGTATSVAADAAIRQIVDRRRRRHKYGNGPEPSQSAIGRAIDVVGEAVGDSVRQLGLPQWVFRTSFVAVVAAVLGWAVFLRGGVKLHSIDGVLLIDGRPIPQATLTFLLPGQSPGDGRVFHTDAAGAFRTEQEQSLREGLYTIVVQPHMPAADKAPKKSAFPAIYSDPSTTPLRVQVSESLSGLKLLVRR